MPLYHESIKEKGEESPMADSTMMGAIRAWREKTMVLLCYSWWIEALVTGGAQCPSEKTAYQGVTPPPASPVHEMPDVLSVLQFLVSCPRQSPPKVTHLWQSKRAVLMKQLNHLLCSRLLSYLCFQTQASHTGRYRPPPFWCSPVTDSACHIEHHSPSASFCSSCSPFPGWCGRLPVPDPSGTKLGGQNSIQQVKSWTEWKVNNSSSICSRGRTRGKPVPPRLERQAKTGGWNS